MNEPLPPPGEVSIRVAFSGVNPGDVKKREDAFGVGMPYPRVISHSDGSGTVDRVGEGVSEEWIGRRVWCYGAQSYRPFGTAAEYTVVSLRHVAEVPRGAARAGGLPRHSWHHCASGRSCCGFGPRTYRSYTRWRWRGWGLRCATCASRRSTSRRYLPRRIRQRDRTKGGRRGGSACRSTSGGTDPDNSSRWRRSRRSRSLSRRTSKPIPRYWHREVRLRPMPRTLQWQRSRCGNLSL